MKILIDIGHPAHVHLFKNLAWEMLKKGNDVLFSVREKSENIALLHHYGFKYQLIGQAKKGTFPKFIGLFEFNMALSRVFKYFKPDITISHSSFYLSQVSWRYGVPNITLEDTGNNEQVMLYRPFANYILTADIFHKDYGHKQIRYNSYHELAYLHPNHFQKDDSIRKELGLKENEKTILFRFISWDASHDIGQTGFSNDEKITLVNKLAQNHRVFISSESILPKKLESYQLKTQAHQIHDVMAQMSLFIGEGATMASECAVLGIPTIYLNTMEAGTIDNQEKHGLLYHFRNSKGVLKKALEILDLPNNQDVFQNRRQNMLSDKIDLTAFMAWFVEKYPLSIKIMKENTEYQNIFL